MLIACIRGLFLGIIVFVSVAQVNAAYTLDTAERTAVPALKIVR